MKKTLYFLAFVYAPHVFCFGDNSSSEDSSTTETSVSNNVSGSESDSETSTKIKNSVVQKISKELVTKAFENGDIKDILEKIFNKFNQRKDAGIIETIKSQVNMALQPGNKEENIAKGIQFVAQNILYPFYDRNESESDLMKTLTDEYNQNFLNEKPIKTVATSIAAMLFTDFATKYYIKHKNKIIAHKKEMCSKNEASESLNKYFTCTATGKKRQYVARELINLIIDRIAEKSEEERKELHKIFVRASDPEVQKRQKKTSNIPEKHKEKLQNIFESIFL